MDEFRKRQYPANLEARMAISEGDAIPQITRVSLSILEIFGLRPGHPVCFGRGRHGPAAGT